LLGTEFSKKSFLKKKPLLPFLYFKYRIITDLSGGILVLKNHLKKPEAKKVQNSKTHKLKNLLSFSIYLKTSAIVWKTTQSEALVTGGIALGF